jgi:hypothetical protein
MDSRNKRAGRSHLLIGSNSGGGVWQSLNPLGYRGEVRKKQLSKWAHIHNMILLILWHCVCSQYSIP